MGNEADGSVKFTDLAYTASDIGKTYVYTVKEDTTSIADGYTYDKSEYEVTVVIAAGTEDADNDGKADLVVTKSYKKVKDAEGNALAETVNVLSLNFANKYEAC